MTIRQVVDCGTGETRQEPCPDDVLASIQAAQQAWQQDRTVRLATRGAALATLRVKAAADPAFAALLAVLGLS